MSQQPTRRDRPHWDAGWLERSSQGAERLAEIFEIGAHRRARVGEERPLPPPEPAPGVITIEVPRLVLRGDRDYWLCRCEGFEVVEDGRRLGVVIGLRFASRVDCPDKLEVRAGRLRQRLEIVRVADVEELDAAERRVVVRRSAEQAAPSPPQLRRRLGVMPYIRPNPTR
jgi:hypothetical protein